MQPSQTSCQSRNCKFDATRVIRVLVSFKLGTTVNCAHLVIQAHEWTLRHCSPCGLHCKLTQEDEKQHFQGQSTLTPASLQVDLQNLKLNNLLQFKIQGFVFIYPFSGQMFIIFIIYVQDMDANVALQI